MHRVYIYIYIYICMYLPTCFSGAGCDKKSIFKQSLKGLNSEFSFSKAGFHTRVKVPSIVGCKTLPRICEMQIASSKICLLHYEQLYNIYIYSILYIYIYIYIYILAVPGHALLWLSLFKWKKKKENACF